MQQCPLSAANMKNFIYILLLLIFAPTVFGQEWRDSLREARKSYTSQDYERSLRQYRSAQKIAPKGIDLSDEMAQAAGKAGKYEQAEKIFAQSSSNKGSAIEKANIQRQIGNTRMHQKKYGEAIESYKESLRNNPSDKYSRYNLAEAMRKQKEQQDQQQKQDNKDQSGQNKKDNQSNKPENKQGDKEEQQKNNSGSQPKNQDGKGEQQSQNKTKLSDKKTERMLDDLMKKEMETKKKFEGSKSTTKGTKSSGKDW